MMCRILGHKFVTKVHTYGVLSGTTTVYMHKFCLRCSKLNPSWEHV